MTTYHRYEPFEGYENKRIKEHEKHIETLKSLLNKTFDVIEKIQSDCDHYYQFSSSGMYKDNYVCKHCGHETEQ